MNTAPVFHTDQLNTEKARSSISYRGAREWNKLPANNRNLDTDEF